MWRMKSNDNNFKDDILSKSFFFGKKTKRKWRHSKSSDKEGRRFSAKMYEYEHFKCNDLASLNGDKIGNKYYD